ncbi:hypothetical protein SAMN06295970_120100 [Noviherbaspirillum suwonense]|uniref:Uncharacterized protein n=1 Tax=Noviherbaspirillum suwonense TaxID=1224511 RepID=A0ABY1QL92_9BURK|nr:hypothetical protein SAMN06295970_120100 [Noviherbaspirillum suwonense]
MNCHRVLMHGRKPILDRKPIFTLGAWKHTLEVTRGTSAARRRPRLQPCNREQRWSRYLSQSVLRMRA